MDIPPPLFETARLVAASVFAIASSVATATGFEANGTTAGPPGSMRRKDIRPWISALLAFPLFFLLGRTMATIPLCQDRMRCRMHGAWSRRCGLRSH